MSKYILITQYILTVLAVIVATYQAHRIAKILPSRTWNIQKWSLTFLAIVMCDGIYAVATTPYPFTIHSFVQRTGFLLSFVGICVHNYIVRADVMRLNRRTLAQIRAEIESKGAESTSGELPPDFWRKEFRDAVRDVVKEDFQKGSQPD